MTNIVLQTIRDVTPRLAGMNVRERTIAAIGALAGIGLAGVVSGAVAGDGMSLPLLVAPLGASAVLLFAVPASPLAQPWSIIGGNTISAFIGIVVAHIVPDKAMAAAIAVGAAILIMTIFRCLHPPGGAASLLGVLGGPASSAYHFGFALVPVALNSVVLVILGLLFHRFSGHAYPHRAKPVAAATHGAANPPPQERVGLTDSDIDAALAAEHESFDIVREDLVRIVRRAEFAALERMAHVPRCADVMSRDVFRIKPDAPWSAAHALLLEHDLRILPVVDADGRVAGVVELHEADHPAENVAEMMSGAVTARADASILDLVDPMTDGRHHGVLIVDEGGRLVGLVTQTDMLVALARLAVTGATRA